MNSFSSSPSFNLDLRVTASSPEKWREMGFSLETIQMVRGVGLVRGLIGVDIGRGKDESVSLVGKVKDED